MIASRAELNGVNTHKDIPHIMVVDDELPNRKLLSRVLTSSYRITEAEDSEQMFDLLKKETFDLILLDIMMPGQNGLEALEVIRRTPEMADLPVILISALSETTNVVRGLEMGANDYIPKPFDIEVVAGRVSAQINQKRTMDVYKQSIAELETAQQMKDRLFRIASHDLKSPLANVRMAESLLREFVADEPTAIKILDMLQLTVTNMSGVIEEFLDMAACQSAGIDMDLEYVEIQHIVMQVVAQYSLTASKKEIDLKVGDLPGTAFADETRLAQVLSNLVSNAIKYSPPQTTVNLWSEIREDKVRIHVADQGPGIPPNERERLFKEFSRLSNRPTGDELSTGLGLWIVKHMVTLQNGTVDVDCPPDGGSVFWVEFPTA